MGTQRILCLWFPDWALQRTIVARPELDKTSLLLTESNHRGDWVRYCNRLAMKRGVRIGMPLSEARTFFRANERLTVEGGQPELDRQALVKLALRCERFSYRIGLEEGPAPEALLMDVTGIAQFFSGERALAEELRRALVHRGYEVRIAISDSVGAAWAAAHWMANLKEPVVVIPAGETSSLEALPVEALRIEQTTLAKLHRLGVKTIRQVLVLDRAALSRRLGTEILMRIDQLFGRRPERIAPCHPLPVYRAKRELEEGILHPEAIEQLSSLVLGELLDLLVPKRLGTRHVESRFTLEDRSSRLLDLRLCEATNEWMHLSELLRYQLEKFEVSSGVVGLQMEAKEVAPIEDSQPRLFASEGLGDGVLVAENRDHAQQYSRLLNRLSGRLGDKSVLVPILLPDPVPERSLRLMSVTDTTSLASTTSASASASRFHAIDRPTALFDPPRAVEILSIVSDGSPAALFWKGKRFDIAVASEVERIESGWWDGEYVCRDYYRLETTEGQWLWVFRRLQDQHWFWHGEFF